MIEIDDAGSGSLIGGTGIGILRTETEEYIFKIIPRHFFQNPNFAQKRYQTYVIKIVKYTLKRLKVDKNEKILVCRGYIFDQLRNWLTAEGYNWESTKIVGFLQNSVENSFNEYVIDLGLPKNFVQHARYAFGFHRLLKWVFADFENRARLCKTGWKSWQKWSQVPLDIIEDQAKKDVYCLKCGKLIHRNEPVISLRYCTTKYWCVDLHYYCFKAQGEVKADSV